jgi:hypothetical protein
MRYEGIIDRMLVGEEHQQGQVKGRTLTRAGTYKFAVNNLIDRLIDQLANLTDKRDLN